MNESYEIEPWMPAISPGAPVPAPKYVPFDYGKMTPGRYFSHSLGYSDNHGWHQTGKGVDAGAVEGVYKDGVRARLYPNASKIHPTAWNYKIDAADLGDAAKNKALMDRITHPEGLGSKHLRNGVGVIDGKIQQTTQNAPFGGKRFSKPRYGPTSYKNHKPGLPRPQGAKADTFVLKGDPEMFSNRGPDYTHRPDLPPPKKQLNPGLSDAWKTDAPKGSAIEHTGHIGKNKIIGHTPAGTNRMVRPAGMITGKMPMVRGFGGGLIDMFMEGPEMQRAKSDPYYGLSEEERRNIELAYQYGI